MSRFVKVLPERPSLEQLQKQAKELLKQFRSGDSEAVERLRAVGPDNVQLADAQFILAREYGFASWAKLKHHVEALQSPWIEPHEQMAQDFVLAYNLADAAAIQRLNGRFHNSYDVDQIRNFVRQRLQPLPDAEHRLSNFTADDARRLVANFYGFEDWASFVESSAKPEHDTRTSPGGLSSKPPFYRIDWKTGTIEPRQRMSRNDWDRLLDVMKELRLSGLDAGGQLTDDALAHLATLDHVTRINSGGTRQLTDKGMLHLSRMSQLEELGLSDYPGGVITDRGLEPLRHLSELRTFNMCWQSGVSDAGIANLSWCEKIENVDLLGSPTGDGAIRALGGKPNLRHLKTGRLVSDAGIPLLRDLPVFKTWRGGEAVYDLMTFGNSEPNFLMLDGPFTDAGFSRIAGLDGIFGIGLFWHVSALTSNGLQSLADLPNLGAFACKGELADDAAMKHIVAIPRLRMLMAQGTVATDDGFATLSQSKTIEYIWGRECPNLHGRGFASLAKMPALKGLAVSCKGVDDTSLAALSRFPALTWLMPMDVSDAGFRHVGQCSRLEKLTCMYCRNTGDQATEHIASLSKLKHYHASQTRITDRSLEILGGMISLEEVELSACAGISNAGLVHIAKLPRLRHVAVDATARVTRAGISVFPSHVRVDFWT